jgi:hypothetical protein
MEPCKACGGVVATRALGKDMYFVEIHHALDCTEVAARKAQIEEEQRTWRKWVAGATEALLCDLCGKHMGWMRGGDLEGTNFCCDECHAN